MGCYALEIELRGETRLSVGSLGEIAFRSGYYVYVGSALTGFKARLLHHLKRFKKPKWHIDYLLNEATLSSIIIGSSDLKVECEIANQLSKQLTAIPDFGSSDCRCPSHLFYSTQESSFLTKEALRHIGLEPFSLDILSPNNSEVL